MHDIILYYEKLSEYCGGQENITLTVSYDKLWKLLIDKKISKTQLVHKSGISTNAMAKMGKNQFVRLEVLIRICSILHCQIDDIIDYSMDDAETERGGGKLL